MPKLFLIVRNFLFCCLTVFASGANLSAQSYQQLSAQELRGALRPERTCFDVTFYALDLELNLTEETISGHVDVHFRVTQVTELIQLDLFENMTIDRVSSQGKALDFQRVHNAFFISLPYRFSENSLHSIRVDYHGQPIQAKRAPWDGGFVWALDNKDRSWVGVSCEGTGASLWWPNKDHLSDEPDSVAISLTVPDYKFAVSNGNLRAITELESEKKTRYDWFVSYPINNYNVSLNVGNYVQLKDTFVSANGDTLDLDYYVLDYNESRAKKHFEQVTPMLQAYEYYLGDYPFWNDGFALIEAPYLGMEHQSGIAYGNRYMRGYLGGMIPRGMNWDYIIVHEAGHEYFGNSISIADHAEMWVHESFTTYLEALYVEYHYGKEKAKAYLDMQRPYIKNKTPILGPLHENYQDWGDSDHYYKGAWMLHTLRGVINDDPLWFGLLRSFYQQHQHSIVNTQTVIDFVNEYTQTDQTAFFDQYLRYAKLPVLELRQNDSILEYRWKARSKDFNMPVDVIFKGENIRIQATTYQWAELGNGTLDELSVEEGLFKIIKRPKSPPSGL